MLEMLSTMNRKVRKQFVFIYASIRDFDEEVAKTISECRDNGMSDEELDRLYDELIDDEWLVCELLNFRFIADENGIDRAVVNGLFRYAAAHGIDVWPDRYIVSENRPTYSEWEELEGSFCKISMRPETIDEAI